MFILTYLDTVNKTLLNYFMSIKVAIVMGSASDWDVMSHCSKMLKDFDVSHEAKVLSAHRTPKELEAFISQAEADGVQVFIAGAGLAAALPGVVAAQLSLIHI